ncbi:MAG: murein hydrolase activator EnvC family protein [Thermodesulfobacteriota bacterium]
MTNKTQLILFPITLLLKIWLITCFLLISGLFNGTASASDKANSDQQLKKISRVKESILDHQEKLRQNGKKEKNLIGKLKKIDRRILLESKKYIHLEQQIQRLEDLIGKKKQALKKLKKEKGNLKNQIQKRLIAYYQMGDLGVINAVFSASSLPELLNFREMYRQMLKHDRQIFSDFKNKIEDIARTRKYLEKEGQKLAAAVSKIREQQKILAEKRKERESLLKKVKTRKALYQKALVDMKAASRELQMTLVDLEGTTPPANQDKTGPITDSKKIRPPLKKGFAGQKGRLIPPVSGNVIKKFEFHKNSKSEEEPIFSEGINIKTEPGDKIRAVYKGKIIYTGILPGYGKIIIIDHGDHYVSLVSGVGNFMKEVGDKVEKGEVIASASLHSGLLQEGIHFEIRHKTKAVDPHAWLAP